MIDKWTSTNQDTIYYKWRIKESIPPDPPNTKWVHKAPVITTSKVSSLDTLSYQIDTTFSDTSIYNGRLVSYVLPVIWDHTGLEYIKGVGGPYGEHLNPPNYVRYYLNYFKKGSEEWGNKLYLSVDKIEEEIELKVFPNPSKGIVNIQFNRIESNVIIELYNSEGKLLLKNNYSSHSDISLDLRELNPGLYHLKIVSDDFVENRNLILE